MTPFGCRLHALAITVFCLSPLTEGGGFGWWQFVAAFIVAFAITSVIWGEWDWVFDDNTPARQALSQSPDDTGGQRK